MDREQEIKSLKEQLKSLEDNIKRELTKIEGVKSKLAAGYRRRDKEKYDAERRAIMENLKKYEAEMVEVRKKLLELESGGIPS